MKAIYEPAGKAREYAPLACNIYTGCTHGCRYCYVPSVLRRKPADFHAAAEPRPGILEAVQREAPKYAGDPRELLLCFTCDPYQPRELENGTTRKVLHALIDAGCRTSVLTKNPVEALLRDGDLFKRGDTFFGTTIVFTRESDEDLWEPNAPNYLGRTEGVRLAHDDGIRTWGSIEPVFDPEQSLQAIDEMHEYVDLWRVGKLNHRPEIERTIDWADFYHRVVAKLEGYGAKYYIKHDLLLAAGQLQSHHEAAKDSKE